ncbi:MAG: hypothetical protein V1816_08465 [Pseudomonadota bacterium]
MTDSRRGKMWRRSWSGFGIRGLFARRAWGVLVFLVGVALFTYPLLNLDQRWTPRVLFLYLYLAWGGIIILLFFMGKSLPPSSRDESREP